jgi:tetratricopeptide (TPR) repeat protein
VRAAALEASDETSEDGEMAQSLAKPSSAPWRALAVPAALVLLSACASAPPQEGSASASAGPVPPAMSGVSRDSSAYGLYLAGQAALDAGETAAASDFFNRAAAADPNAGFLKDRVFMAALMSGDVARAAAIAPANGEGRASTRILGVIAQSVEAMAEGRGGDAYAALVQVGDAGEGGGTVALLKPWAAAAAGRWDDAIALPNSNDRLIKLIAGIDQGLLFERRRNYGEAETAFKALLSDRVGQSLVGQAYGEFLERRGRRAEAIALYDQILAGGAQDPDIAAARARAVAKGTPPAAPSLREGAAQALLVPAAAVLADKQSDLGLIYLRLALRLDPKRGQAWLLVGDVMTNAGDVAGARAAFTEIATKSPEYADARSRLAWSYQQDDPAQALKLARETVQQLPADDSAKLTLADLLRADKRYDEAAELMTPIIAAAGEHAEWRLFYMRGVALERAGRWPEAERDLQKALQVQPGQPEVLNYLGYSWVNRGEHVQQGLSMIQKALEADPDEGAYVDSLGWAYFRLGDYKQAVQLLERAVTLDAGDAEINDHLGDAYWRIGRQNEARFQWRAALTMNPDADIKARAEAKLDSPLGLDVMTKTPPVAHP